MALRILDAGDPPTGIEKFPMSMFEFAEMLPEKGIIVKTMVSMGSTHKHQVKS